MAKYTMELREIVENNVNIFDGITISEELKEKIINNFYFREIGVETVGRFLFNLKARLNVIMPFFQKRYDAVALEQRILDNYDVVETFTKETTSTAQGTNKAGNKRLFSDTPQGRIDVLDYNPETGTYSSTGHVSEINHDLEEGENTLDGNGTENWSRTMKGNIGVQTDAQAVKTYLDNIVNVDLELFNALEDLFMGIY